MSFWRRPLPCAALCLLVTLAVFAPRLWLMRTEMPGTFQWDRARTYLQQSKDPFRRDIEPAMLWRVLPPLAAHTLGLKGKTPLVLPWLGVVAMTAYVAALCRRRLDDPRYILGGTLLFTASSAVLAPAHWLGLNDAWTWLGLLAVAFGRSRWATPLACLLAPWVDERFIIGLPLALLVRATDREEPLNGRLVATGLWLLPYAVVRVWFSAAAAATQPTEDFLRTQLGTIALLVPWAPLGWWMAWRAGWLAIAYACTPRRPGLVLAAAATLGVSLALASDLSRSAAILAPLALLGVFDHARRAPATAPRTVWLVALGNLLIPAAHVTFTKFDLISPLPIEIIRLFRISAA